MNKAKMKLKNQMLLVNICILGGLILQYFRGLPVFAILVTGILLFSLVNVIFFFRVKRFKKLQ
jgi:hypothetical protein